MSSWVTSSIYISVDVRLLSVLRRRLQVEQRVPRVRGQVQSPEVLAPVRHYFVHVEAFEVPKQVNEFKGALYQREEEEKTIINYENKYSVSNGCRVDVTVRSIQVTSSWVTSRYACVPLIDVRPGSGEGP